jgi:hypothetical protein
MKRVPGYPEYAVDPKIGAVYRVVLRGGSIKRQLAPIDSHGYLSVQLSSSNKVKKMYIHRVVYSAHTGKAIPDGLVVNHKNGDPKDNRISNLELVTQSENCRHAFRDLNKNVKRLSKRRIADIRGLIKDKGMTRKQVAAYLGLGHTTVCRVSVDLPRIKKLAGSTKTHVTPEMRQEIIDSLFNRGIRSPEVAAKFCMTVPGVLSVAKLSKYAGPKLPYNWDVDSSADWRHVPSMPGCSASANGNVRGPDGVIRSKLISGRGYAVVYVTVKGTPKTTYFLHRLIAEAFHGKAPSASESIVDHINKDKSDNIISIIIIIIIIIINIIFF